MKLALVLLSSAAFSVLICFFVYFLWATISSFNWWNALVLEFKDDFQDNSNFGSRERFLVARFIFKRIGKWRVCCDGAFTWEIGGDHLIIRPRFPFCFRKKAVYVPRTRLEFVPARPPEMAAITFSSQGGDIMLWVNKKDRAFAERNCLSGHLNSRANQ